MGEIRNFAISLLLVVAVVMGLSSFYTNMASSYGLDLGGQSNLTAFDKLQNLTAKADEMRTSTESLASNLPGQIVLVLTAGFSTVNIVFESFAIFTTMVSETVGIIGIPPWFADIIIVIVTLVIVFAIIAAAVRWDI